MSVTKIVRFDGPWAFLSNFFPAAVEFEGTLYPTAEHAYQAAKCGGGDRLRILAAATPGAAKRLGRRLKCRSDWDDVRDDVMYRVVLDKFRRNGVLKCRLLETGNAVLIEGNTWGDRYWGMYRGQGLNKLGRTLQRVREELRGT